MHNPENLTQVPVWLVENIGQIALWLSTAGLIIVLWIIFQIINLILNKRKKKVLELIKQDLKRIETKINKLSKNKK